MRAPKQAARAVHLRRGCDAEAQASFISARDDKALNLNLFFNKSKIQANMGSSLKERQNASDHHFIMSLIVAGCWLLSTHSSRRRSSTATRDSHLPSGCVRHRTAGADRPQPAAAAAAAAAAVATRRRPPFAGSNSRQSHTHRSARAGEEAAPHSSGCKRIAARQDRRLRLPKPKAPL